VDTLGLILAVVVHAADIQDRDGGRCVLERMGRRFHRLRRIWADGGYAGAFVIWARQQYGRLVEIVKRSDMHRFVILPKRWIVERTFAWLGKYRRLSKDYETLPASSEMMIYLAMINLMIHRLKPGGVDFSHMLLADPIRNGVPRAPRRKGELC